MKTKPKKTEVITIRLDRELMEKVRTLADESDRTYGREINYIVREWIKYFRD